MLALAVSGVSTVQLLLAVLGSGGLLGAVVALLKLRPDANTAAVTQSQGAIEVMARLNEELEKERDDWRRRALSCERDLQRLQTSLRSDEQR